MEPLTIMKNGRAVATVIGISELMGWFSDNENTNVTLATRDLGYSIVNMRGLPVTESSGLHW